MSTALLGSDVPALGARYAVQRPRLKLVKPVAVYYPSGAGDGGEAAANPPVFPAVERILSRIADAGFTIVSPTLGGAFGNTADLTSGEAADTHGVTVYGQDGTPPVVRIGMSRGTTAALREAALRPANTACVVGFNTVCGLDAAYQGDIGSNRAGIGTAYGVAYPAALPANADPAGAQLSAALAAARMPLFLHSSSDDPYHPPLPAFATAVGSSCQVVDVGALGHSDASIAASDINAILAFIKAHT